MMNNTVKQAGGKVGTYDYKSDFLILTLKEKWVILKNARHLLKLQKENAVVLADVGSCEKQRRISL
ncbi:MAG: hypothetical protein LBH20_02615 [Treponema sp.]|jgi:hypothetical protein|nr:hypothetical protein [Treponema sp.]